MPSQIGELRDLASELAEVATCRPESVGIGLGSLLADTGREMATAALPGFLRRLGGPAAALGAIEGVADAVLSASKVAGGVLADQPGMERKAITAGGYALTGASHGAFALATTWPVLAVARAVSWIARGGKAAARDSLLTGSVNPAQLGRAFGVERAMDSLGAVAGPAAGRLGQHRLAGSPVRRGRGVDGPGRDRRGRPRRGIARTRRAGRGFGLVGLVDGVGDLVSSVVVGVLFTVAAPAWGFSYAAVLSVAGAFVLSAERPRRPVVQGS